jgi:hypothetical protein
MATITIPEGILGLNYRNIPEKVTIDLGDERLNHNLMRLIHRKAGEIFEVQLGYLIPVENLLKYTWENLGGKKEREINEVVSEVIEELEEYLQENKLTKVEKVAFRVIFAKKGPLLRLNQRTFDRSSIKEDSKLERLLFPELSKKRGEFFDFMKSSPLGRHFLQQLDGGKEVNLYSIFSDFEKARALLPDKKLDRQQVLDWVLEAEKKLLEFTLQEALFTQRMGIEFKHVGDSGSGGACKALDRYGNPILSIKPGDEASFAPQNRDKVKKTLFSQKECARDNSETDSEISAYIMNRKMQLFTVPPTMGATLFSAVFNGEEKRKLCSLKMWVTECQQGDKFLKIPHWARFLPKFILHKLRTAKLPDSLAEKLGVHSLLAGDVDSHTQNFMVKRGGKKSFNENSELKKNFFQRTHNQDFLLALFSSEQISEEEWLSLINHDGGLTFPRAHPKNSFEAPYQYLFTDLLEQFNAKSSTSWSWKIQQLNKDEEWEDILEEIALLNFKNVLKEELAEHVVMQEGFKELFRDWLKTKNAEEETRLRDDLEFEYIHRGIRTCLKEQKTPALNNAQNIHFAYYLNLHLQRIRQIYWTGKGRWAVFQANLSKPRAEAFKYRFQRNFSVTTCAT